MAAVDDVIKQWIREAQKSGELARNPYVGKPFDLEDGFLETPARLRMARTQLPMQPPAPVTSTGPSKSPALAVKVLRNDSTSAPRRRPSAQRSGMQGPTWRQTSPLRSDRPQVAGGDE